MKMEVQTSDIKFTPFDITFKVKSIEELQELYDIVGELRNCTNAMIVYDKIETIIANAGFTIGVKSKPDELKLAASEWFIKNPLADQEDSFIAGFKYRRSKIKPQ